MFPPTPRSKARPSWCAARPCQNRCTFVTAGRTIPTSTYSTQPDSRHPRSSTSCRGDQPRGTIGEEKGKDGAKAEHGKQGTAHAGRVGGSTAPPAVHAIPRVGKLLPLHAQCVPVRSAWPSALPPY